MFPFFKQTSIPRVVLSDGHVLEYKIKLSSRSRRVRLRLTKNAELIVMVPPGFKRRKIERLVYEQRDWITHHIRKLIELPKPVRPETLELHAIGEIWKIGPQTTREALKRELSKRGREVLIPWLETISREIKLRYSKSRIKGQRTRWGSCSTGGVINLNYHLLFLPPNWVRYVLIHELCHTVELNHTRAFWSLVVRHVPDAKTLRKELRTAGKFIPQWMS